MKLLVAVVMMLSLMLSSALADSINGVRVMEVVQNGGEVIIYITQATSSGVSNEVYKPDCYTVKISGQEIEDEELTSTEAKSMSQAGVQLDYTLVCDATMSKDDASKVNNAIKRFAAGMDNERLHVVYYQDKAVATTDYVYSDDGLSGTGSTRLRSYYLYEAITPDLNAGLSSALESLKSAPNSASRKVRNVIVIITDTDAPSFSSSINDQIRSLHIPVYLIMLSGGKTTNAERYTKLYGGETIRNTAVNDVTRKLEDIRDVQKNLIVLKVYPKYETFQAMDVTMSVTINNGTVKYTSESTQVQLDPGPVPVPSPTPSPTPTQKPVITTPPPKPTTPPPPSAPPTPPPTPTPTRRPTTPPPSPTPTRSPEPYTVPPITTRPPTPTPSPTPTATPQPDWIKDNFGEDGIWILGAGALFLVALIILLVILISSKKKKKRGDNSLRLSTSGSSMDDVSMTTPNVFHHGDDDLDKTTYGNKPQLDATQAGGYGDDLDKTTSPFASKPADESMLFAPAFGSGSSSGGSENSAFGSQSTVSDGYLVIDEEDENEKTVAMTDELDENEKTVRMEDEMGIKMHLTVDYEGRIKDDTPAHQEIDTFLHKKLTIGRGTDCDVCLKYDTVSKHHLEITYGPDGLFARDLKSSNGTKLNGEKITDQVAIKNQDELMLGFCKVKIDLSL
ncbi:MAG: FHA domain-containing protein [Clostridia bacterium]|nr:FHA domain-containing protein [Clostridia bacterium]